MVRPRRRHRSSRARAASVSLADQLTDNPPAANAPAREHLISAARRRGGIPLDEALEIALCDPEVGYFRRARPGRAGDYFTPVSAGPLLGKIFARIVREWAEQNPNSFLILELGAGEGYWMGDLLGELRRIAPAALSRAKPVCVELKGEARRAGEERLARSGFSVQWSEEIKNLSGAREGIVCAFEFLDALPVRAARRGKSEWEELFFIAKEGKLCEQWRAARAETRAWLEQFARGAPRGYRVEIPLAAERTLQKLSQGLERGWIFFLDYGRSQTAMLSPAYSEGTLAGHRAHQKLELAEAWGWDISHFVNWTAVARAAREAGFQVEGIFSLSDFLLAAGEEVLRSEIESGGTAGRLSARTLLDPREMGGSHQVLALSKNVAAPNFLSRAHDRRARFL